MQAVLEALRAHADRAGSITIVSRLDLRRELLPRHVVDARGSANGWKNSKKEPVANRDLWEPLVELFQRRAPAFRWVKGHSGDPMNDLVDRLAVGGRAGPFERRPRSAAAPRPPPTRLF